MSVANVVNEINLAPDAVANFKALGIKADVIAESTAATGVTIDGVKLKDSEVTTDTINEKTAATGVTIDSLLVKDGGLASPNATTGIGYSTGAGGAVTQATDKTTGVTLNTITGTITTNNAALAAAAEATFTVTNSAVAIGDVVILSIQSGGTSGEYLAHVTTVAAGSFDITLANMSASSASDAVLINFAVIKAVSA